ncbi:3-hydroxyacyl-CoA dehydrogenase NAD-binding domain-containing protein [Halioxenophilus sp. WMMB6]|uniref:3-hydroxyacyl-CoA dehydrogenase NAD-binding domain-containing protein n=1 Tax=Halioxenophilus sp. WMMB6 TaxID=3073815 RepID=UPI00295F224E|nr:3-hydroxyacyl-CoA dehydrogenase NAD-binding domain-containing protein [Halioxenophilus sp. WMMB6]
MAVITINNPPVNAINSNLIADLKLSLDEFNADADAIGAVFECQGRTFIAGGDLAAFNEPDFSTDPFNSLLMSILHSERPIVAALFGTVLGGGLELAMACQGRVARRGTKFGMPEISLGLIPGSFGTQNLPRLVGLRKATDMIISGKPIDCEAALASGLIDATVGADETEVAKQQVRDLVVNKGPYRHTDKLSIADLGEARSILAPLEISAKSQSWLPAIAAISETLTAAVHEEFQDAIDIEKKWFLELLKSSPSKALRYGFIAEREARKIPSLSADSAAIKVKKIGVIGAGTMGAGIATAFLNAGFPVTIVDASEAGIQRGKDIIEGNHQSAIRRGRMTEESAADIRSRTEFSRDINSVNDCELIIEAVFENMDLKLDIATQLGKICKPGAIIATNTSTLDVDKIAAATGRAGDFIGTHFFSPAHIMRLLEVVRGAQTQSDTLQTVMSLASKIGKVPVVCGVCYGFIGNRMAEVYMRENEMMQLEGVTAERIDYVIQSPQYLGMAMGPNRMLDMAGVDVGALTVIEWLKSGTGPADPAYRVLCRTLNEMGDHGQKTGQGYYRYENRQPVASEKTAQLASDLAAKYGVAQREVSDQEVFERLLYPMINEAAAIMAERITYRASDIDVIWTSGYGFPAWRGGPLFMADEIGLSNIVERLDYYADFYGNDHGYWTVSPLLRELAVNGGKLTDWCVE